MYKGLIKNMCGATVLVMMMAVSPLSAQNTGLIAIQGVSPYMGTEAIADGQFILGMKMDVGSLPVLPLRIIPEMATSIGNSDASMVLALSAQLQFIRIKLGQNSKLVTHARAGVGSLWSQGTDNLRATINFAYGITLTPTANPENARVFVEHQGIDKFKTHRILIGLTWGR